MAINLIKGKQTEKFPAFICFKRSESSGSLFEIYGSYKLNAAPPHLVLICPRPPETSGWYS